MKKLSLVLLLMFSIAISFAQVKRVKTAAKSQDSTAAVTNAPSPAGHKKEMMKELNLTKEQKGKLKEIKQAGKSKMDEVLNDTKLSADEKKSKLKSLRMEQFKNTMAVLNDEQKAKMKEMRRQNKKEEMDDEAIDEQK
jgi:Spy/CpxP family protein refolding chaperone